jgi:predicted amidohydrolase
MAVKVACLQMCSTVDVEANWSTFERLSLAAIAEGAQCIFSPENTFFLGAQFHKVALAQSLCKFRQRERGLFVLGLDG